MRGEPWRYFNLLSAPGLSLNAQFLPVPPKFVVGPITDTVLGTLNLATCAAPPSTKGAFFTPARLRGATLSMTFDVFSGERHCKITPAAGGPAEPTPCAPALASAGVNFTREVGGCSLAVMSCGVVLEADMAAKVAQDPSVVRASIERLNVSLADGVQLSIVRDLIDRPELSDMAQADCSRLEQWARALRACEVARAYARGQVPIAAWQRLGATDRTALLAFFTAGNRSKQFHFHNVRLSSFGPLKQHEVHGLLGQRAISPVPMRAPVEQQSGDAAWQESPLAAPYATTLAASLELGGGGGGGGGGSGGSVYMTLRTAVSAEGQLQGEGAIEGSFRDYQVTGISSHGRQAFAYSQFTGCAAGEERK